MKFLLMALLAICSSFVFAQETWRNGVIIDNDGNKLTGLINDKEWRLRILQIEFKETESSAVQIFTPEMIKSFSTDRPEKYESWKVLYDSNRQVRTNLPKGIADRDGKVLPAVNPENVERIVLLQVIVDAPVSLLQMVDEHERLHFFVKQNNEVKELLRRETVEIVNEQYKWDLTRISAGCDKLTRRIELLKYNLSAMKTMVEDINECQGYKVSQVEPAVVMPVPDKPADFGILGGAFITNIEYGEKEIIPGTSTQTSTRKKKLLYSGSFAGVSVEGGLYYEFYSKRRPNRMSIYNEIVYMKVSSNESSTSQMHYSKIRVSNSIRFSVPKEKDGRLFASLGINFGERINTVVKSKIAVSGGKVQIIDTEYGNGFELGFLASVGRTFAVGKALRLTSELRYSHERQLSKTEYISASHIGVRIQLKGFSR